MAMPRQASSDDASTSGSLRFGREPKASLSGSIDDSSVASGSQLELRRFEKKNVDVRGLTRLVDALKENLDDEGKEGDGTQLGKPLSVSSLSFVGFVKSKFFGGRRLTGNAAKSQTGSNGESYSLLNQDEVGKAYGSNNDFEHTPEPDVEAFIRAFEREVRKVSRVCREAASKIRERLEIAEKMCSGDVESIHAKKEAFEPEFQEMYRQGHFISDYATRNYTSLIKILEHDKVAQRRWFSRRNAFIADLLRENVLEKAAFAHGSEIKKLLKDIRHVCAKELYGENEKIANYMLLKKRRESIDWNFVFVGYWVGAASVIAIWASYVTVFDSDAETFMFQHSDGVRIYRFLGALLLMFWGFGIQIAIWREARINFPVIFDIPSSFFPTTSSMFRIAAVWTLIYCSNLIVFVKLLRNAKSLQTAGIAPLSLLLLALTAASVFWFRAVFLPRVRYSNFGRAVKGSLHDMFVGMLGISEKGFLTAFLSDYLTSSTKILIDIAFLSCSFLEGGLSNFVSNLASAEGTSCQGSFAMRRIIVPIVTCWPLWLRLFQNLSRLWETGLAWPFLANAGKYALAHTVVIFTAVHPDLLDLNLESKEPLGWSIAFILSFGIVTLFTFTWDVVMDWGLGRPKWMFLRKRSMLETIMTRNFYYVFIFLDFFMRYLWTVTLLPSTDLNHTWIFSTGGLICLEIIRRTFWGVIRVENEHLNNTRMYRDVEFVPLYFDSWQKQSQDKEKEEKASAEQLRIRKLEIFIFCLIVLFLALIPILL